jgi:hypothetical protein
MLRALVSLAIVSTPVCAQARPDSVELSRCGRRDCVVAKVPVTEVAEIRQAVWARERGQLMRVTIRADTAWAEVLRLRSVREGSAAGTLATKHTVRVERRGVKWVAH